MPDFLLLRKREESLGMGADLSKGREGNYSGRSRLRREASLSGEYGANRVAREILFFVFPLSSRRFIPEPAILRIEGSFFESQSVR